MTTPAFAKARAIQMPLHQSRPGTPNEAHPPYGVQNLWPAYPDPLRMMPQGNPDGLTSDQVLRRTFDNARGAKIMEVYDKDVVNLKAAVTYGAEVIGSASP